MRKRGDPMSKIEWFRPSDKLPEHNQRCLIVNKAGANLWGPIGFKRDGNTGIWLDMFGTPEAGEMVGPDDVGAWCAWDDVKFDWELLK